MDSAMMATATSETGVRTRLKVYRVGNYRHTNRDPWRVALDGVELTAKFPRWFHAFRYACLFFRLRIQGLNLNPPPPPPPTLPTGPPDTPIPPAYTPTGTRIDRR